MDDRIKARIAEKPSDKKGTDGIDKPDFNKKHYDAEKKVITGGTMKLMFGVFARKDFNKYVVQDLDYHRLPKQTKQFD